MPLPTTPFSIGRLRGGQRAKARACAAAAVLLGLALSVDARAAAPSDAPPPAPPPRKMPELLPNPGEVMQAMARELDKHPDQGVFVLQNLPITQGEMADVIRMMPVSMASLGFAEVSRRAIETLVSQKAMVLNALKEGLDKDPTVIRKIGAMRDRALADAWLIRQGDAAVTDQALHARYDHDVAGRPGPTEVRARVILVRTEEEGRTIIEKLQNGADFGDLAKQSSKDASAAAGGDLGYASFDGLTPEIAAVAFALNLGLITSFPVPSASGYFVLRVEGRRQRATPTFDEVKSKVEASVRGDAIKDAVQTVLAHIKMAPVAKPADAPKK